MVLVGRITIGANIHLRQQLILAVGQVRIQDAKRLEPELICE